MYSELKMSFNGDVIICTRALLDNLSEKSTRGIDMLASDTCVSCEAEFAITENGKEIGSILDNEGCCELYTLYLKDFLDLIGVDSMTEVIEKYRDEINDNCTEDELSQGGDFCEYFIIKNFKGVITNKTTKIPDVEIWENDERLKMVIEGINTETEKPISLILSEDL